jgi:AcrR family transcriptional regulator
MKKIKEEVMPESDQKKSAAPQKKTRYPTVRMPQAERRAQILSKACEFFSEHGITAQTRALADACGVSQRLLYSVFPNKAALLAAVYETEIAGPIKAIWFVLLKDRSKPVEQRVTEFYQEYYDLILTRRWLRLFLHVSLSEGAMAPAYITKIVANLLEIIVEEAAHEAGLRVPEDPALTQEIGWILHGSVSHLAIRRHIYQNTNPYDTKAVITLQVKSFMSGLKAILPAATGQLAAMDAGAKKTG